MRRLSRGRRDQPTDGPDPLAPVVLSPAAPDRDLIVNSQTGEIRTKRPLDRETTASYALNAIPLSGDSVRVSVEVADINDNTPTFPESEVDVDIPENTPLGTTRQLPQAVDADDSGQLAYRIESGNDEENRFLTQCGDDGEITFYYFYCQLL